MFTSALVALDLSKNEEPILDCLPDLMNWGIHKVTLAHVIPVGYNQFAGYGHEDDYLAWLDRYAAPLREAGLEVETQVRDAGAVADAVLTLADELDVDLVVIGSRGQNRMSGLFLGSVARDVIRKATRPTLLEWVERSADKTRDQCEAVCTHSLKHLLLATDFSEQARKAEEAFIELSAGALIADLLTVLPASTTDHAPAKAALNELGKRLSPKVKQVEVVAEEGKPSDTIARVAAERRCSLIIVGKHGEGWLESKFIGTTAARLCEMARRPVLMVPIQEEEKA